VQEIIDTEFQDCTVVAIIHCLKFIERYDKVIRLDGGSLAEDDRRETLAVGGTRFKKLLSSRELS
jgi:ATP-binding cassette, subfamily C (CFTR/MRP), member 1